MGARAVILAIAFCFLFRYPTIAQRMVFTHLNVENGLSQNSVLAIAQDSRGFMWFGNRYGLNRYDGHGFKLYKNIQGDTTSLSNDYILSLFADTAHTLWIGTTSGLNKYDLEKDQFERIPVNPTTATGQDNAINCVYEDRKGSLWVGTAQGLFVRAGQTAGITPAGSGNSNQFTPFFAPETGPGISGNNIRAIYEDHEGALWIGTNNGLTRMQRSNNGYAFQIFRHSGSGSISDNYVTTIVEDNTADHNLWIGTLNGGLNRYDRSKGGFDVYHRNDAGIVSDNIRKIITDKEGKLWIGTLEGVSVMDPVSRRIHSYQHDPGNKQSLGQNSIYSIFRDINGSIWIGTYFGGVNITYSYATPFTTYENSQYHSSISNNVVSAFTEAPDHNLWIGTEGGGLNYFNRASGAFATYENKAGDPSSLGSNLVKAVCRDREGNLWIGTHGGGLNLFDPVRRRFRRFLYKENDAETLGSEIAAIMEDSEGRLWVGSQAGIRLFNKAKKDLSPYQGNIDVSTLKNKSVKVIFEDSKKNIWVATTAGLYRSENKPGDETRSFSAILNNKGSNSVNANFINCVQEDARGRIWIGMYYEGLVMYDVATQQLSIFTEKDGLPNNNVMGILEDKSGNLWLSTDNGLSKFDSDKKTFRTYTSSDGLASNEFNYNSFFKDCHGEMFFGGYSGFISFFPDRIETNNYAAPVVFTSLKLFNIPVEINAKDGLLSRDVSITRDIRFRYDQDVFTLGFALLNYIKSNKNRYAYMLEGFDKGWNEVSIPSATYTNLPPGDYTFLVKGANNDGVWSKPASLHITVLPPFWKTWWAYCIYVLALGGLLFLIIRFFFLRELLKRENVLHQAKLNFFTNISHEIRTHLALIIGPVEKMLLQKKEEEDVRQLRTIKKNSESLLKLVSELMDFRKAESGNLQLHVSGGNIVSFVRDIYTSFQNLAATKHIHTDFVSPSSHIALYFDKEQLEKVFFNLLSNAFKFTPAEGSVNVMIEDKARTVEIRVIDNGKGIAPENLDKLFLNYYQENDYGVQNTGYGIGLALSQSITELHKGKLSVESEPGIRTCFTLTLLKGEEQFSEDQLRPARIHSGVHIPEDDIKGAVGARAEERTFDATEGEICNNDVQAGSVPKDARQYSILLVEDNPELRRFIRDSLEGHYQIMESDNGVRGWECAIECIPDLIISDVMMPEMDGYMLCGKLKSDARTSHIPIILLTAKTSTVSQVSGLQMGADTYLTKPFSIHVLELHVRNLLESREMMRQKFSREFKLEPKNIVIDTMEEEFLQKAIQYIEDNMEDPEFGVQALSTHMTMSQPVLYKKIKALTDMSVNDFIKSIRLKRAAQLLQQKALTIYEVAYAVGYSDRKYFSKEFKKQFGKTPSEFTG